jgi:hypothetical protein
MKKRTTTVAAEDLKAGDIVAWSRDCHSRVLDVGLSDGTIFCRHQRTGSPHLDRGLIMLLRKGERIEVLKVES